jgi:hypothetical protein
MGEEIVTLGTLQTKGCAVKSPECYKHPVVRVCLRMNSESVHVFSRNIHLMVHKGRAFTLPVIYWPSDMLVYPSLDTNRAPS